MTSGALSPEIGTVQGRVQGVNRQNGGVELAGRDAVQGLGDIVAGQARAWETDFPFTSSVVALLAAIEALHPSV